MRMVAYISLVLAFAAPLRTDAARAEVADLAFPTSEPGSATGGVEAAFEDGLRLAQDDQLPEALVVFGQVVARAPQHAGALHMLGLCCWLAGNPREASIYLTQAARGTNAAPQTLMALAAIAAQNGSAPECVGWMKRAFRRMSPAEQRAWIEKSYFRNVRNSEAFQSMVADLPPVPSTAEDARADDAIISPR